MKSTKITQLFLLIVLTFSACKQAPKQEDSDLKLIEDVGEIVEFAEPMKVLSGDIEISTQEIDLKYIGNDALVNLDELYELPDELKLDTEIPEIFGDYHTRNFITGVADKYNIIEALGHLYEKDSNGKLHKVSLKKLITGKFEPKIEKVDKVYFENVLTDSTQVKAGIKFLSIEASKSSKVELLIKDEVTVLLPDNNKDFEALKKVKELFGDRIKNLYFSYGATLSSITHKTYNKSAWRPAINSSWFTFSRDKHIGQKNFSYRSDVHVDLIALDKMIFPAE